MIIKCRNCGHTEKVNKELFLKILGGTMVGTSFWAWVTYLLAGTGFALAIVIAIMAGGTALLIYKTEIVQWIINRRYKCKKCGNVNWES